MGLSDYEERLANEALVHRVEIKSQHESVIKCEAIIAKYEPLFWGKPLRLGIEAILKDDNYIALTAEEKAIFALLMTARAA